MPSEVTNRPLEDLSNAPDPSRWPYETQQASTDGPVQVNLLVMISQTDTRSVIAHKFNGDVELIQKHNRDYNQTVVEREEKAAFLLIHLSRMKLNKNPGRERKRVRKGKEKKDII
ncbi:hypothetical protein EVAR_96369_1 [Eumeta japonica]|uniref:Uncharacterized protein n=1 Tax=Eumeta variegata TaxID=151549 RepID=A0A4C1T2E3_EUMVA|nr:hypothetical protein EVAR_96369_1 [Eumeta japonica]